MAATVNPNFPVVVVPIVVTLARQFTTTAAAVIRFKAAQRFRVVRFAANMRAKGGTHGTSTADLKVATVSILSALPNLAAAAAGVLTEGTLAAASVVVNAEQEVTIDLNISGGTAPTMDDVTIQIDVIPE